MPLSAFFGDKRFLIHKDHVLIFEEKNIEIWDARTAIPKTISHLPEYLTHFFPAFTVPTNHGTVYFNKHKNAKHADDDDIVDLFAVEDDEAATERCMLLPTGEKKQYKGIIPHAMYNDKYFNLQDAKAQLPFVPLPGLFRDAAVCFCEPYMYIHGGRSATEKRKLSNQLVRIHMATMTMEQVPTFGNDAPNPCCGHAMRFVAPHYLVLAPGFSENVMFHWRKSCEPYFTMRSLYVLNLQTYTWSKYAVQKGIEMDHAQHYCMDHIDNHIYIGNKHDMIHVTLPLQAAPFAIPKLANRYCDMTLVCQ